MTTNGKHVLNKLPYIKYSIVIALLTFFISTTFGLYLKVRIYENQKITDDLWGFLLPFLTVSFIVVLLVHPTGNKLNFTLSPFITTIVIVLNCLFYLTVKFILNEKVKLKTYITVFVVVLLFTVFSIF